MTCHVLTNHASVLSLIANDPGIRLRDVAAALDLTDRAIHRIVCELEEDGYLTRHRTGRRNFYEVHAERPLERALAEDRTIGDLLGVLLPER
ncbi:MAG: MarR family transcriptional regulator [Actinomycetota bacterium]|nr:MarR family transcriptional regulator [Actinomycetota bacterium]